MAHINVPVSDEKIIALVKEQFDFDPGKGRIVEVRVNTQAPASNSTISHVVSLQVDFGLELGAVEGLVGY